MANITLTTRQWAKKIASSPRDSKDFNFVMGWSPNHAAALLNVSRQMISKLQKKGKLDTLYICDTLNSKPHSVLITIYSIEKYKRERRQFQQVQKSQQSLQLEP